MWPIRQVRLGLELTAGIQRTWRELWTHPEDDRLARETPAPKLVADGGEGATDNDPTDADHDVSAPTDTPDTPPWVPTDGPAVRANEITDDGEVYLALTSEPEGAWIIADLNSIEEIRQ